MAKIRPLRTPEEATGRAISILGAHEAAAVIGKSIPTTYEYADPDKDKHISVRSAMLLDAACSAEHGEAPFFDMQRLLLDRSHAVACADVVHGLLEMHAQAGKLNEMIILAKNPHSEGGEALSVRESHEIMRQVDGLMTQLSKIREAVAVKGKKARG